MSHAIEIRRAVLTLLARRDHSKAELQLKLVQSGFALNEVEPALDKLEAEGLLNEKRFLENFITVQKNKGLGPVRIKEELLRRGLTDEVIAEHLPRENDYWLETLRHVWQKRFKNTVPKDYKARMQQMRFLQYRGFTFDQIKSVIADQE